MTEKEYVDATNLAKLRLAIHALSQTIGADVRERQAAIAAMYAWQDKLEKVVKTREET